MREVQKTFRICLMRTQERRTTPTQGPAVERVLKRVFEDFDIDPAFIRSKPKGGRRMYFVETHFVIDQLNHVFNHQWNSEIKGAEYVFREAGSTSGRMNIVCEVKLKLTTPHGFHEDIGFGSATNLSPSDAHEVSKKAAVSDAIKRCARQIGRRFGNCLYRKDYQNGIQKRRR